MNKNMDANKSDKKALKHNTIALVIIQILNYVLPFITLPYVARIFRVEDFGVVFFALVIQEYAYRLVMFGYDFSAVREIAIHSANKKVVNLIYNSAMGVQLVFLLIGFLIMSALVIFVPKFSKDALVYLYTYIGLGGVVLCANWFYQGMARMKFITILNIIARSLSLIMIFVFIKKADDYILFPLINSLGIIIAGVISTIFLKKIFGIKFYIPKFKILWKSAKYSSEFFLTKVSIGYRGTNTFVFGLVASTTVVAYYAAADKIFWAVISLYSTFIAALFPYMSKNKDFKFFKKMLKYLVPGTIVVSIILCILSKYIILIFFSDKYMEAVKILQIFSLSFSFYIFVDTFGFPFLGSHGYVKETNQGYIFGGVYNCIGLILLWAFNFINLYSVAILVSTTFVVMFLHRIYYIKKYKLFEVTTE